MSVSRHIEKLWQKLRQPGSLSVLYHGVTLAPRLILHVASLAALVGMFNACVPATRYEEAKSASEVESAGRQRAEAELVTTRAKLEAAQAALNQRGQELAETEQSVSQSKFESTVAVKERDEATGLVDQLRGELARVGDSLRSYAEQKADLEKSLQAAQTRKLELERSEAHTVAIARLTRDVTSLLGERVTSGDVLVDVRDGHVVLSAPPELWFNDDGSLRAGMASVLAGVSRVMMLYPESSLELGLPAAGADKQGTTLQGALASRGVAASRVKISPAGAPVVPAADAPVKAQRPQSIELSFSVG